MDCPIRVLALLVGVTFRLTAAEPEPPTPKGAETKRARTVSPRVAEMLSVAIAKQQPAPFMAKPEEASTNADNPVLVVRERLPIEGEKPANGIVRLPDYIVQERKPRLLPTPEQVMGPKELEKLAMNEFLGPEDGIDRGLLNLVTIPGLWRKIPVLGHVPLPLADYETNEERALRLYRADRKAKEWAAALEWLTPEQKAAIAFPTGSAPKKK